MAFKCKACKKGDLKRFIALGNMPSVNNFLKESEVPYEKLYPLNLAYCPSCLLVQLEEIVPPEELFTNYLHLSSASNPNVSHLREVADMLNLRFEIGRDTKILEIGSNDGTLLAFLKEKTNNVLGVDPAKNLIEMSRKLGVETLPEFFNTETADKIVKSRGKYDLIVALNVIPHTPDVVNLLESAYSALNPKGSLVMEGAYAIETILKGEFDTIYHEHVYSFSLHSLISTFRQAKLKVVDVQKIPTQGGSLRIFAQREEEAGEVSENVKSLLEEEAKLGLADFRTYDAVASKAEEFRNKIKKLIEEEKARGGKLIGLGAPARGVVILNYCKISPDDIEYILDDTTLKQDKVCPGMHIPVKSWDTLDKDNKRTFLLLSWNYKDFLLKRIGEKYPNYRTIIPFPNLEVKSN